MSAWPKNEAGVSQDERRESATDIRQVQNVALADATAKAGVSPWTPAMFRVGYHSFAIELIACSRFVALRVFARGNTELLHQRLRWIFDGRDQLLSPIQKLLRFQCR